jgi:hypothetical protein
MGRGQYPSDRSRKNGSIYPRFLDGAKRLMKADSSIYAVEGILSTLNICVTFYGTSVKRKNRFQRI